MSSYDLFTVNSPFRFNYFMSCDVLFNMMLAMIKLPVSIQYLITHKRGLEHPRRQTMTTISFLLPFKSCHFDDVNVLFLYSYFTNKHI